MDAILSLVLILTLLVHSTISPKPVNAGNELTVMKTHSQLGLEHSGLGLGRVD